MGGRGGIFDVKVLRRGGGLGDVGDVLEEGGGWRIDMNDGRGEGLGREVEKL